MSYSVSCSLLFLDTLIPFILLGYLTQGIANTLPNIRGAGSYLRVLLAKCTSICLSEPTFMAQFIFVYIMKITYQLDVPSINLFLPWTFWLRGLAMKREDFAIDHYS